MGQLLRTLSLHKGLPFYGKDRNTKYPELSFLQ